MTVHQDEFRNFPVVDPHVAARAVPIRFDHDRRTDQVYGVVPFENIDPEIIEGALVDWPRDAFAIEHNGDAYLYVAAEHILDLRDQIEESGQCVALNLEDYRQIERLAPIFEHGMAYELAGGKRISPSEALERLDRPAAPTIEPGFN